MNEIKVNDQIQLCIECAKDIRLKKLIRNNGVKGLCTCCENNEFIIDVEGNEFIQMIKALIRYHFSEWDYNKHWGGDGYIPLIEENFINKENFNNQDICDELMDIIDSFKVYENYDEGVSIFAGYSDGEQNPLLQAIKTNLDYSITDIAEKLKTENYFKFEDQITKMLLKYVDCAEMLIKKENGFYRARTGVEDKKRSVITGGFEGQDIFVPFSGTKIGAPPPGIAGIGRLNRAGVTYLYCATDKYTAISEIRPHPGDVVSIGKFITNRDLRIFDLTDSQFLNFYQSDKRLREFGRLNTFSELMQQVIPPAERHVYSITQLIADCIRKLDFDGILFASSVGTGDNLVVFEPELLHYTFEEAEVVEIKEVNYQYFQRECRKDVSEIF